jgi:hypothetical protein
LKVWCGFHVDLVSTEFHKNEPFNLKEKEKRDQLLANVKKEVKQLMEEAVTKKFVHEDSACLTSLCATIEQCLLHGLQRRSVGLFKSGTTMALLQKVSKNFEPAEQVLKMCADYDDAYCNSNFSFIPRYLTILRLHHVKLSAMGREEKGKVFFSYFYSLCFIFYSKKENFFQINHKTRLAAKPRILHRHSTKVQIAINTCGYVWHCSISF